MEYKGYDEYVKRLGQQHWSKPGESHTMCGMSMLGNNYAHESLAEHIVGGKKVPCRECRAQIYIEVLRKMTDIELHDNLYSLAFRLISGEHTDEETEEDAMELFNLIKGTEMGSDECLKIIGKEVLAMVGSYFYYLK